MAEPNFVYTRGNKTLTHQQRQFYEDNGYLVIPKLVSEELLDECTQRFIDICDGKVHNKQIAIMKDISLIDKNVKGQHAIYKIYDIACDEVLFKYINYKPILDVVEDILGPNISALLNMIINKPPTEDRDASRHPLHQDTFFVPFRPPNDIVAAWTAMEKVDEQNGCLFVVPGSHKGPVYHHDYQENVSKKAFQGVFGLDYLPKVNFVTEKGDTVFFHPTLLHGSGPNLTQGFRKVITSHYVNSDINIVNVRGTFQEKIAVEFEQIAKKKRGTYVTFEEYWLSKARLIRGQPGLIQKSRSRL